MPRRQTFAAIAFLLWVPVVLFLPAFFFGQVVFGQDLLYFALPLRTAAQQALSQHEWPLWQAGVLGGLPNIASSNLVLLYPTDLLASLLGVPIRTALSWDAAFQVALAGLGMFAFLRRLKISPWGALLGAFFFSVSGAELSQNYGGYVNLAKGVALIPWAFWAGYAGWQKRRLTAWAALGCVFALQLLAVAAQLFVYTLVAVGAMLLYLEWRQAHQPDANAAGGPARYQGLLGGLITAVLLALLLAAPQVWLTAQYLPYSARGHMGLAEFNSGALSPKEWLTWFVPGFFGWRTPTYHGGIGVNYCTEYLGLAPWALAAAAFAVRGRKDPWVGGMLVLAAAAFILAIGPATPLPYLLHPLPVISGFRYWSRILCLFSFAICTLAAMGWDDLTERHPRALRGAGILILVGLAAAGFAWWAAPGSAAQAALSPDLIRRLGDPGHEAFILESMARNSAVQTAWLLPVLAALMFLGSRLQRVGLVLLLLLGFHAYDMGQVVRRYLNFEPPNSHMETIERIKAILPEPSLEPWRVYSRANIFPNDAILFGYETLQGMESMPMRSMQRLENAMQGRLPDYFALMNVRWFLTEGLAPAGKERPLTLHEDASALPRAWLSTRVRVVHDDDEAFRILAEPAFNPRHEVLLESDPGIQRDSVVGSVRWTLRHSDRFSLEVENKVAAILVVSNAWYPSWRCEVDGVATPVLRADGALQAVKLKPGLHRVDFHFGTGLFYAALAASLLGGLVVLALGALAWRQKRRRGANN